MRLLPILLPLALAGCHLIDQRDFDPRAGEKPKAPAGPAADPGPGAFLTITYGDGTPDYAAALAHAVHSALAAKPNVQFNVSTVVPASSTPQAQETSLRDAAATGREIAEAIVADGADAAQIEQSVRTEPSAHAKQVQLFVH